ncbi:MAG TPA: radical SAM protein [Syntrophorhabdaceae bacterium]|nr:radical SAM protein [Syntrophorhabdaceae bacterium]
MDFSEFVGELMDLIFICAFVEAFRANEDLSFWRPSNEVYREYVLETGVEYRGLRMEIDSLCNCGVMAAHENRDADVVTMTAYVTNLLTIAVCALRLRQVSKARVVIGGPSVTQSSHTRRLLLASGIADVLIAGDGEDRLPQILNEMEQGVGPVHPGVYTALTDLPAGDPELPSFATLRTSGLPEYSDLDWIRYQPFALTYEVSRGCPARCAFCSEHSLHGIHQNREPKEIIQHLEELRRLYSISRVYFVDSTFNFSDRWLDEFCAGMSFLRKSQRVPVWACQLRADMAPLKVESLREAGLRACNVGAESFDDGVLVAMRKAIDVNSTVQLVQTLLANRIEVNVNQVVGFPGETEAAFLRSLDRVMDLIRWAYEHGCVSYLNVNVSAFHTRPWSQVYINPELFGIEFSPHDPRRWPFMISKDLREVAIKTPFFFKTFAPTKDERKRRKTLMMHEISEALKSKQNPVRFDWRGEAILEVLQAEQHLTLNPSMRFWTTSDDGSGGQVHYCKTWFGVHPFCMEHMKILWLLADRELSVGEAVQTVRRSYPANSPEGVWRFLAHLVSRGVLVLRVKGKTSNTACSDIAKQTWTTGHALTLHK